MNNHKTNKKKEGNTILIIILIITIIALTGISATFGYLYFNRDNNFQSSDNGQSQVNNSQNNEIQKYNNSEFAISMKYNQNVNITQREDEFECCGQPAQPTNIIGLSDKNRNKVEIDMVPRISCGLYAHLLMKL
jgi:hypothetical protein